MPALPAISLFADERLFYVNCAIYFLTVPKVILSDTAWTYNLDIEIIPEIMYYYMEDDCILPILKYEGS